MTFSFKHIGLLTGVVFTFLSFLFFGRHQGTYQIFLIGGLVTAILFFFLILFGKGHLIAKVFWIVVVILCTVVQQLTEPFLIDTSYRIYISQNKNILAEINNILVNKQGDFTMLNDSIFKGDQLNSMERGKLQEGRKKLGVYIISKSGNNIYYGLWGFLDVRLGITYLANDLKPGNNYRHLAGNWFH
ncbi:MAG: hypothetical protein V4717_18695 [Bacteroidota bacterium]